MKTTHTRWFNPQATLLTLVLWIAYYGITFGGMLLLGDTIGEWTQMLSSLAAMVLPLSLVTGFTYPWVQRGLRSDRRWAGLGMAVIYQLGCLLLHGTLYTLAARYLQTGWLPSWWAVLSISLGSPYALTFAACAAHAGYVLRQEQKQALLEAQLRALRSQLQPHFLFNTLHAIGVTAQKDGPTAARMTTLLGDMLRASLHPRENPLVPLAEEHALLQPYLQLQQLRFADRLRVEQDLDTDTLRAAVPDLILQPLVENALQHGIERKPGAGVVKIRSRRHGDQLLLEVSDDGAGLNDALDSASQGLGLTTTRERLRGLFGVQATLELRSQPQGGTTATLRIPYRECSDAA